MLERSINSVKFTFFQRKEKTRLSSEWKRKLSKKNVQHMTKPKSERRNKCNDFYKTQLSRTSTR